MDFRIPTKFSVGGLGYRVDEAESLRYGEEYGHWDGTRCLILLAHRAGGEELSEERKAQTFFHELTHAVLDAMGEDELNENEQFIDAFSNLFYQAVNYPETKDFGASWAGQSNLQPYLHTLEFPPFQRYLIC